MSITDRRMAKKASMQELLDAALQARSKVAADAVGTQTSSGITAPAEDKPVVEGATAKANDAHLNETLGAASPVSGAPAGDSKGDINPPMQAAKLAPAGEDPTAEKPATSIPAGADSGTSLPGATLGGSTIDNKVANWQQRASDVLTKLASEQVDEPVAADAPVADDTASKEASDIYTKLAQGNVEEACQFHAAVSGKIAEAMAIGRHHAVKVAAYLSMKQAEAEEAEAEGESSEGESGSGDSSGASSESGTEDMAASADSAPTASDAGAAPAGGDNVTAVLELLASLSPEELSAVMAALTGGGMGGDPMAGGAPAADPMAAAAGGDPMAAAGGDPMAAAGIPPEALAGDPKLAHLIKVAADIATKRAKVKRANTAKTVLDEIVQRGTR